MNDCIDRPDTRLHPTNASEAQFATCNAGAIHTRQAEIHPERTARIRPKRAVQVGSDESRKQSCLPGAGTLMSAALFERMLRKA